MRKKLTYIISDIDKALAFEWLAIAMSEEYDQEFVLLNPGDSYLERYLREQNIRVSRITCRSKKDWAGAFIRICAHLKHTKPDIVHCHLLAANILGLTAARVVRVPMRVYTRHHSSQHHLYHKKGLIWDKLSNACATHIVAISNNVRNILINWEGVESKKVHLVPHGFKLENFGVVSDERVSAIREKYQLHDSFPVIGVISRFIELKGVEYVIRAFKKLLEHYPKATLMLFNGHGDYERVIFAELEQLPHTSYRVVQFEFDIAAAFKAMNIFVHIPIDAHGEAFGQIYVESLAAGTPSIFTLSGIATDFIKDHYNAIVVDYKSSDGVYRGMMELLGDAFLMNSLTKNGWESVKDVFDLQTMIQRLKNLYEHKAS